MRVRRIGWGRDATKRVAVRWGISGCWHAHPIFALAASFYKCRRRLGCPPLPFSFPYSVVGVKRPEKCHALGKGKACVILWPAPSISRSHMYLFSLKEAWEGLGFASMPCGLSYVSAPQTFSCMYDPSSLLGLGNRLQGPLQISELVFGWFFYHLKFCLPVLWRDG